MARCKDCIHYKMCAWCVDAYDCAYFTTTADVAPKSEVEALAKEVDRLSQCVLYSDSVTEMQVCEAIDKFRNLIINKLIELCNYNDYGKINLLLIGDTIDRIYDKCIDDVLRKKGGK